MMLPIPCRLHVTRLNGWVACLLLLLTSVSQAQQEFGNANDPVVAEALGVQIRSSNPGEMAYIIKQMLMVNYAKEHGLKATPAEVEEFIAGKQQADVRVRKELEARSGEIQKALQANGLPESERKQLQEELNFLQQMQQTARKADQQAGGSGRTAAETQMARAIIGLWRVNRALYKQYGGRVIYQQGGPEPLDAYNKFFRAEQQAGKFRILNREFESAFWSYYSEDSKHKFYPDNEKDQAINTPWWQKEPQPGK